MLNHETKYSEISGSFNKRDNVLYNNNSLYVHGLWKVINTHHWSISMARAVEFECRKQYTYILKFHPRRIYMLLKNCRNNSFLWLNDEAIIIKSRIYLPTMLECIGKCISWRMDKLLSDMKISICSNRKCMISRRTSSPYISVDINRKVSKKQKKKSPLGTNCK